jgi:hypothetical protein
MRKTLHALLVPVAALSLAGCAAQHPVLYSGPEVPGDRQGAAAQDLAECEQVGEAHASPEDIGAEVARDTTAGGLLGAVGGAVAGAVYGSAGRGTAAGAAGGAATGLLTSLVFRTRTPEPIYQAAVSECLALRGHRVIGWQ